MLKSCTMSCIPSVLFNIAPPGRRRIMFYSTVNQLHSKNTSRALLITSSSLQTVYSTMKIRFRIHNVTQARSRISSVLLWCWFTHIVRIRAFLHSHNGDCGKQICGCVVILEVYMLVLAVSDTRLPQRIPSYLIIDARLFVGTNGLDNEFLKFWLRDLFECQKWV